MDTKEVQSPLSQRIKLVLGYYDNVIFAYSNIEKYCKSFFELYDMPVGICLLMMYFLMETLNDVQLDSFNTEHFIKKLITLALAIIVVISGDKIFDYIASFGDALANEIRASLGSRYNYGLIKNTWLEICGAGSGFLGALVRFLQYIAILVGCLVSFLVNLIAGIVIAFISYARIIEIVVRYLFAPIGCASLVSGGSQGGLHSPGMRYIKKFAAVCIQGAVIVAAAYAENYMQACSSATVGVIGGILMPLSLIGVAIKTKGIAEEIVGV